jgi:hypothetical protein
LPVFEVGSFFDVETARAAAEEEEEDWVLIIPFLALHLCLEGFVS